MPFLKVDAIIGKQAFQNGRCHICSSLGLHKVKTDFNLLMELKCTHQMLIFHIHTGLLAVSFYLLFGATLSLTFKKVKLCNKILRKIDGSTWKCNGIKGMLGNRGSGFDAGWLYT